MELKVACLLALGALTPFGSPDAHAQSPRYDVVIHGGHIIDGTGAPWYQGDLAISNGRIAAIGRIAPALGRRAIDATGKTITPGFIDMMGQTAAPFLADPAAAPNLISQSITTINAGEGESDAPLGPWATPRSARSSSGTRTASDVRLLAVGPVKQE